MYVLIKSLAVCWLVLCPFSGLTATASPWLTDEYVDYVRNGGEPPFFIPEFFPDQDWIAERSIAMRYEYVPISGMGNNTQDAILEDFRFTFAGLSNGLWAIERRKAYWAAIASDNCARAFSLFWDEAADRLPYIDGLRRDHNLIEEVRWRLFSPGLLDDLPNWREPVGDLLDHRYLATCLAFEEALYFGWLIADWAERAELEQINRPFEYYPQLVAARDSIHAVRDSNVWHLIHLATQGPNGGYGPAGLRFAQIAVTRQSVNVPDDVVHMLLLRARETWPEIDLEEPIPILLDPVERLLALTGEQLDADELARAERCFMTNEPYDRLFMGEAVYFAQAERARCATE